MMTKWIMAIIFVTLVVHSNGHAETIDKKFINWLIYQKNDIVEFQKKNWDSSKKQFKRNKDQLSGFFSNLNLGN
jgi:hypothetical protein